jgi:hypothetical protein
MWDTYILVAVAVEIAVVAQNGLVGAHKAGPIFRKAGQDVVRNLVLCPKVLAVRECGVGALCRALHHLPRLATPAIVSLHDVIPAAQHCLRLLPACMLARMTAAPPLLRSCSSEGAALLAYVPTLSTLHCPPCMHVCRRSGRSKARNPSPFGTGFPVAVHCPDVDMNAAFMWRSGQLLHNGSGVRMVRLLRAGYTSFAMLYQQVS